MHRRIPTFLAAAMLAAATLALPRTACAESVAFGTDWKAEAEHGGFYQAIATGIYKRYGLEVNLRPGGPQVNHAQLLAAGVLDFNIASNSFVPLNFVREKIPMVAVAAIFQKDPSVLIAHPGQGNESFAALKGKPIMISADTRAGWWNFLRAKFGYTDSQIRPYNFSLQPFLADKSAVQQGFLGSEPYSIRQQAGIDPVMLLVADAGFTGYAQLLAASDKTIAQRHDVLQRFVDASIEGWISYLHGDPAPANAAIRKDNPEMTAALLEYGRGALVKNGILESGDATTSGIGAMTAARWADFHTTMAGQGLYPKDLDVARAYTLDFVNHRAGLGAPK